MRVGEEGGGCSFFLRKPNKTPVTSRTWNRQIRSSLDRAVYAMAQVDRWPLYLVSFQEGNIGPLRLFSIGIEKSVDRSMSLSSHEPCRQ